MSSPVLVFGRTPSGQLVHDLLFTKLSERYLARKHRVPIAEIRSLRDQAKRAFARAKAFRRAREIQGDQ